MLNKQRASIYILEMRLAICWEGELYTGWEVQINDALHSVPKQQYTKHNRVAIILKSAYHLSRSNGARKSNRAQISTHWREGEVEWRGLLFSGLNNQTNTSLYLSHRSTKSVWPHAIAVEWNTLIGAPREIVNKITHNGSSRRTFYSWWDPIKYRDREYTPHNQIARQDANYPMQIYM